MTTTTAPRAEEPAVAQTQERRCEHVLGTRRSPTHRSTVLGLLPHTTSAGAARWATEEAVRTLSSLLVLDCRCSQVRADRGRSIASMFADLPSVPLTLRCVLGRPVDALLSSGDQHGTLVLGRSEEMVDLDTMTVVRRSRRAVAVVPDCWTGDQRSGSVVVALGEVAQALTPAQKAALARAMVAAARRSCPVTVVADWRPFAAGRDHDAVMRTFQRRTELVRRATRIITDSYPSVPVRVEVPVSEPAAGVLRAARDSNLLVLPRGLGAGRPGGVLGPVLAECVDRSIAPVLVTP